MGTTCCFEQILEARPYKTACVWPLISHLINLCKQDEQDMLGTAGEVRTNSLATFSYGLLHMDTTVLVNQQRLAIISSVQTLNDV